ncbi:hypothetical protein IQ241_09400 [Romeria aff. gracilis LEGE 07310]|uniref:Uncharacterized protein n=1 Tax=Vasconcelosia minhoensis LEGE 07310 TaxID=915328 RepID=A0A8J7DLR3_9CYAN|nr:hypothetical protein [Romeria gracilis]MBE9077511.1 hypothetical protein [Romeria aff. gracilis LEGE 07310]
MEAFTPLPPHWTEKAVHAHQFCCPACGASNNESQAVWVNRRAPVYTHNHKRKWQEFYHCQCDAVWWAWSTDRPPSDLMRDSEASEEPWNL